MIINNLTSIDNPEYFNWLVNKIKRNSTNARRYSKLLETLHSIIFRWTIPLDKNRAADGEYLRFLFALECEFDDPIDFYTDEPCTVLEMMVALANRCESHIMQNLEGDDNTYIWFWEMIDSLGLKNMTNDKFDYSEVYEIVERFLDRRYTPNGEGGLFIIHNPPIDMRQVEIWYQLNWYLNEILDNDT